jgi:hypothetical protein
MDILRVGVDSGSRIGLKFHKTFLARTSTDGALDVVLGDEGT